VGQRQSLSPEERLNRLLDLQTLLAKVSRDIGPALELEPVLGTILAAMRRLVAFRGGSICLVDDEGVYIAASDPAVSPEVAAAHVPLGEGVVGRCMATRTPVYSSDLDNDPRVDQELRRLGSNATMNSYLAVPLLVLGQAIGVLQVDSIEKDAFTTDDLSVLEGLATQVAGAIASARRYEQMIELERLKSDFIGRVSHELRTPLTIISGFAQTLKSHDEDLTGEVRKRVVDKIARASDRLGRLIDELLTVSSFEAGVTQARVETIDIAELLRDVADHSAQPDKVSVEYPPGLTVTSDPKLLGHALNLLVDNALKYAGSCDLVAPAPAAQATGDRAPAIAVRDRGQGVPQHLRGRVFERFVRGDHTAPGMGLGLALALRLTASLDTTLELEDTPGGGATFVIRFDGA
jgi:K+-sensing histidine kinase KdpD